MKINLAMKFAVRFSGEEEALAILQQLSKLGWKRSDDVEAARRQIQRVLAQENSGYVMSSYRGGKRLSVVGKLFLEKYVPTGYIIHELADLFDIPAPVLYDVVVDGHAYRAPIDVIAKLHGLLAEYTQE